MKAMQNLQTVLDQRLELISAYFDRLTPRDRVLAIFLLIFVLVSSIGAALWYTHAAAEKQQKRVNQLKETMTWMQSNAVTMKSSSDGQLTPMEQIQRIAQHQGLSVASQQNAEQIQLVVSHANYVVLANFLTQLTQNGLSIEKMELVSDAGQIKLSASVK